MSTIDKQTELERRAYLKSVYPNIPAVLVDKYFNIDSMEVGTFVWLYPELINEFYTAVQLLVPGIKQAGPVVTRWYSPFGAQGIRAAYERPREFALGGRVDLPMFNLMFMNLEEMQL